MLGERSFIGNKYPGFYMDNIYKVCIYVHGLKVEGCLA